MTEHPYHQGIRVPDLARLPLHLRRPSRPSSQQGDGAKPTLAAEADGNQPRKRFPENLHFNPGSFRLRSRTESTRSSISSAHVPDSATTYSVSTLASPLSSSYASDIQERLAAHTIDASSHGRMRHRHQPSTSTTCSTFINDDGEAPIDVGFADITSKIGALHQDCHVPTACTQTTVSVGPLVDVTLVKEEEHLAPDEAHVKEEEHLSPDDDWSLPHLPCDSPTAKSDTTSVASDDLALDDADAVLDFTLQLAYGIELRETRASTRALHQLVYNFVHDLGQHIWQTPCEAPATQTMSVSSSSTTPLQGTGGGGQGFGKRKKQAGGDGGADGFSDGEGSGLGPVKRPKPSPRDEENLRLSCPFRKRNPHRFNVRDHHSCAMTYFPKFAELRQHIVKQHKRDDPSAFVCDRCTRDFGTRKELREHQRQPKEHMCDISDHDPESGIDGPTAIKLVSRKRASGTSAEVQWREIWNILFPDDDDQMIQPHYFTPVIEHFELSAQYLASFDFLQSSLRNKISNPATLETLSTKFHECFIEAVESCASVARSLPYANRSNKRNEPARVQNGQALVARKPRAAASRPDSGVIMDDGSEESGSVLGSWSAWGHRDSLRTVQSLAPRRGSTLAPTALREVLPAPTAPPLPDGAFAGPLSSLPLGLTPGGVDASAAVQAWNHGVALEQAADVVGFGVPEHWLAAGSLARQAELAAVDGGGLLYQTDFGGAEDGGFMGFSGR